MRMFLIVLTILMFTTIAFSEEMVSVPKSYLLKVKDRLEKLQALEKAVPTIKIKGIEVVQDAKNRVFIKDTAAVEIKLAMLEFADDVSIKGKVKQYFVPKSAPFVSRFGLATVAEQASTFSTEINKNSVYLTYKIFGGQKLALESVVNFRRWGAGISHKISPNTKILVGANWRFKESVAGKGMAFAGVGFQF